jgi:hypothetical protein
MAIQIYTADDITVRTAVAACALACKASEMATKLRFGSNSAEEQKKLEVCIAQLNCVRNYQAVETTATGIINVTADGGTDADTTITINGVTATGSFRYTTDDDTTAGVIATAFAAITSTPNYTAVASGSNVIITPDTAGSTPNGYQVLAVGGDVTITAEYLHGGQDGVSSTSNHITEVQLDHIFNNIAKFTGCCYAPLGTKYKPAPSEGKSLESITFTDGSSLELSGGKTLNIDKEIKAKTTI